MSNELTDRDCANCDIVQNVEDLNNGYDVAIKALEQESKREQKMTFNNLCNSCLNYGCEFQPGIVRTKCAFYMPPHIEPDNCGNYVVMQPVNPKEPKTGYWIKYGVPRCGEQHYKCTSCGYYINFGQWGEIYTKEFKYCHNCGCRMVEPQDSEKV